MNEWWNLTSKTKGWGPTNNTESGIKFSRDFWVMMFFYDIFTNEIEYKRNGT